MKVVSQMQKWIVCSIQLKYDPVEIEEHTTPYTYAG